MDNGQWTMKACFCCVVSEDINKKPERKFLAFYGIVLKNRCALTLLGEKIKLLLNPEIVLLNWKT